ncbi:hypothetical protein C359_05466 [Cryptococcus neoformans Bt120]|nr:hypothetical protein C360_05973 [Cryptococcus neoformans var. grubii Bt15]OXG35561.1 hypothetical protein C359_05466 [Cryptococcus neoformans var. grubii Bt120]
MKARVATTGTRAPGIVEETEEQDELRGLRSESKLGLGGLGFNLFSASVGSRNKTDEMLGLDANAKLASLYLVSGLGKSTAEWSLADTTRGVQPLEDSLGLFWRPDMLGSCFSGDKQHNRSATQGDEDHRSRKNSKSSTFSNGGLSKDLRGKHVADAGQGGAQKLVAKTLKFAHPRDGESPLIISFADVIVEIVNSVLAPPTTCHGFTFTIPRHDTLAAAAREWLEPTVSGPADPSRLADASTASVNKTVASVSASELSFYGATLTVWTNADKSRALQLKAMKSGSDRIKFGTQYSMSSMDPVSSSYHSKGQRKASTTLDKKRTRGFMGHVLRNQNEADITIGSETETGMSDSDMEGPMGRRTGWTDRLSVVESVPEDVKAVFDEQIDVFWMPYAITLVGPLLKERPCLEKVDFQIWPLFQALDLDLDYIITCAEVALSNSGRIIFCSKHPAMLNIPVNSLKYLVDLCGWNGIAAPVIHARDATFIIEDPGPWI